LRRVTDAIELGYTLQGGVRRVVSRPISGSGRIYDPVQSLAIGSNSFHTCAVLASGHMRCWGTGRGALGVPWYGNLGDDEFASIVGHVPLPRRVVQASIGGDHSCALLSDGSVSCWGENHSGAVGVPGAEDYVSPVIVDVGGPVVQIATGHRHTCALLATGNVRCWGDTRNGRLGYGSKTASQWYIGDDETPASLGDVDVGGQVKQIVAGAHTCALLESGNVRCWGLGSLLGYGNQDNIGDDEVPALAGDVNVGGSVLRLTAGSYHTCAVLVGGAVRCWGDNGAGQLGYGHTRLIGDDELPYTAGDVNIGGATAQLAAGDYHTCALLATGKLRCWGFNSDPIASLPPAPFDPEPPGGQLGYGHKNTIGDDELPFTAGDVNVGGPVVEVRAGALHTCALLASQRVRCWGEASYGQLGYGNESTIGDDELPFAAGDVPVQ
jgi:alpha-tubulin suppressor-like RCC1 family protein